MTKLQNLLQQEAELAERAVAILTSTTNAVLATIRADGSPRVSGIDPFIVDGELCIGSMDGARKAQDLARDPRMALHSIPWESRRIADGATGNSPPRTSECPTRPVCHSCAKIRPPSAWTASVTARHPATCSCEKIPGVNGLPMA